MPCSKTKSGCRRLRKSLARQNVEACRSPTVKHSDHPPHRQRDAMEFKPGRKSFDERIH